MFTRFPHLVEVLCLTIITQDMPRIFGLYAVTRKMCKSKDASVRNSKCVSMLLSGKHTYWFPVVQQNIRQCHNMHWHASRITSGSEYCVVIIIIIIIIVFIGFYRFLLFMFICHSEYIDKLIIALAFHMLINELSCFIIPHTSTDWTLDVLISHRVNRALELSW